MNKCSPVNMRKALKMVEAFREAGIEFVPVPVKGPIHKKVLLGQCLTALDDLERQAEEAKR